MTLPQIGQLFTKSSFLRTSYKNSPEIGGAILLEFGFICLLKPWFTWLVNPDFRHCPPGPGYLLIAIFGGVAAQPSWLLCNQWRGEPGG